MIDTNELKSVMAKKGLTQEEIAMRIGISKATFNYKLNNKYEFKVNEIERICDVLCIDNCIMTKIFFAKKVD